LRRAYSYNDGVNFTAERWPPWRRGIAYDAGLFFVGYQRDPRTGFIRIFEPMAKLDSAPRGLAQPMLELGEKRFDRVQVRRVLSSSAWTNPHAER
jgi:hypothetical protein